MLSIKRMTLLAMSVVVMAVSVCFPFPVFAVDSAGSIMLKCPVEDQSFSLFRIADINEGGYTYTEEMSGYSVELTSPGAADTLSAYVLRDNIVPIRTAVSGYEQQVIFDGLSDGVYLIIADRLQKDGKYYTIKPALISVPRYINNAEERQITAECKYEVYDVGKRELDVSVIKVWKSDDGQSRPRSVTVQLLRNGAVFDIAILNSSNSWKYVWKDLSFEYEWKVVEKDVPSGYKVSVESDGAVSFTITNSGNGKKITTTTAPVTKTTQPTTSPSGTDPHYTNPTVPTEPVNTPSGTNPTTPQGGVPKIPQTGQLWWPVTWFVIGGCLMIIIGVGIKRNS